MSQFDDDYKGKSLSEWAEMVPEPDRSADAEEYEYRDTEGSYNGDNPNGWGWTDTSFVYRSNGDIVATVIAEISEECNVCVNATGSFMGAYNVTGPITHVVNSIIRKLNEYGY